MIPTLNLGGVGLRRTQAAGGGGGGGLNVANLYAATLYTGNGTGTRTITTGIDMTGGGFVMILGLNAGQVAFFYSPNGASPQALTNTSGAASAAPLTFDATGISLTSSTYNVNTRTYVVYCFKKAARFLDVVTYSGTGANRTIAHGLTTAVALNIVKRTDSAAHYTALHQAVAGTAYHNPLSATGAAVTDATVWNSTTPTSGVFSLGSNSLVNDAAGSYVAILFAHDTAADGIIRAVNWTGNGSSTGPSVSCGWQPQMVTVIPNRGDNRSIFDTTRSPGFTGNDAQVPLNVTIGEFSSSFLAMAAAGFDLNTTSSLVNANANAYYGLVVRAP